MSETPNLELGTSAGHPRRQAWLGSKLPASSSAHRLFCFAYAGGSATIYNGWADALAPRFEVCPIELPGHWLRFREPPYHAMDALQADLLPALSPYMRQPFSLFGYSLGALIAYVLARNVQRGHSVAPQHFFAAAAKPPQLIGRMPKLSDASDATLLDALAKRYAPIPEPIVNEPELLSVILRITRADFRILESYEHRNPPKLQCPISVFGGDDDEGIGRELLQQWQELSEAPCTVQMFPGNHFFINQNKSLLVAAVQSALSSQA